MQYLLTLIFCLAVYHVGNAANTKLKGTVGLSISTSVNSKLSQFQVGVNPRDHVRAQIIGLKPDNTTSLGDKLTYTISLIDNTYASLIPANCKYYNPNNPVQNVPFVTDNCPRIFPTDPEAYFSTMVQLNYTSYAVSFRAFSFESTPTSSLAIDCDILLCTPQNIGSCYKSCWGGSPPPTETPTDIPPTAVTMNNVLQVNVPSAKSLTPTAAEKAKTADKEAKLL